MIPKTLRSLSVVISVVVAIALSGCSGGGGSGGTGMTGGSGGTGMTELDAAKADVTRLEGELAAAPTDADVAAVQTMLDAAKADVTRLEGELAAAPTDADVAAVQTMLDAAKADVTRLEGELAAAPTDAAVAAVQTMLDAANAEVTRLEGELAAAPTDAAVAAVQTMLDAANAEVTRLEGELAVPPPDGDVAAVQTMLDDANADVTRLEGELAVPPPDGDVAAVQTMLDDANAEVTRLEGELAVPPTDADVAAVQTMLDDANADVTRLEGELAAAPTDADVAAVQTIDLMPGPGLTLSNAAPVFAPDETSKLQATLADAASGVPVLSATLSRTFGVSRSSQLTKDFYVKTIRTDGNGAYVIGYVLDGTEAEVTIPASACVGESGACEVTVDGRSYYFWSWTPGPGSYDPFAHEEFQYMASFNLLTSGLDGHSPRMWFVFGARTENLPMGGATFNGRFGARSYETANTANTRRQQYSGNMRLVANFDMSQLDGRIYEVRGSQPGQNSRTRWPTSSFTITNGQIKNGQFTATLTGIDSDPNAPFDTSVRDVMGHILGEFYGPNAEEVGGVVTATRDVAGTQNDRVFFGFVGGRKVERVIAIDNTEVLVTAVYRDFDASSTAPFAVDMPTVEATEDVLRITYVVDGQTEIIEVRESDFGAYPGYYYKRVGDTSGWLWSLTGSFIGPRDFDHFDINGWTRESHDANNLDVVASSVAGFAVYGTRTTNMPTTGTASYEGHMGAVEFPSDDAVSTRSAQANMYQGDVGLMANFTSSTVTGNVTNLESRPGNTGTYVSAIGGLNFNATINGNALTASDLAGTGALARYSNGSVKGAFYGPDAAEVGGVFNAADGANNRLLNGWFGGKKQ